MGSWMRAWRRTASSSSPDDHLVVIGEGEIGGDAVPHARVLEAFAEAFSVRAVGDPLAGWVDVVLVVGDLDVGEERAPLPDEEKPPPHEVAGGSHVGGIGIGAGHQASSQEHGGLLGVHAVALGLGAVDEAHVEGVTEDEGDALLRAQVGEPVPTVDALDGDDQVLAVGRDGEEEAIAVARKVSVQEHRPVPSDDAEVHCPRVQIDPAVVLVRQRVEVHGSLLPAVRRVYSPPSGHPAARGPV